MAYFHSGWVSSLDEQILANGAMIYNRARMLRGDVGRFQNPDTLGYPDGMNYYAAFHVMHGGVDPMGLLSISSLPPIRKHLTANNATHESYELSFLVEDEDIEKGEVAGEKYTYITVYRIDWRVRDCSGGNVMPQGNVYVKGHFYRAVKANMSGEVLGRVRIVAGRAPGQISNNGKKRNHDQRTYDDFRNAHGNPNLSEEEVRDHVYYERSSKGTYGVARVNITLHRVCDKDDSTKWIEHDKKVVTVNTETETQNGGIPNRLRDPNLRVLEFPWAHVGDLNIKPDKTLTEQATQRWNHCGNPFQWRISGKPFRTDYEDATP